MYVYALRFRTHSKRSLTMNICHYYVILLTKQKNCCEKDTEIINFASTLRSIIKIDVFALSAFNLNTELIRILVLHFAYLLVHLYTRVSST